MDPAHLEELARIERDYWWHVTKRRLAMEALRRFLPPPGRLVEGGFGGGEGLRTFGAMGYEVCGLDRMAAAVEAARARGLTAEVHDLDQPWPPALQQLHVVVLLDVLEHLDDPAAALGHAREALAPGGGILVTVPAWPELYGPWDEMLGHKRRYTRRTLAADAARGGLRIRWMTAWNAFSLPAAVAVRLTEQGLGLQRNADFPAVHPVVNRLLCGLGRLELRATRLSPLPLGLSLLAVLVP